MASIESMRIRRGTRSLKKKTNPSLSKDIEVLSKAVEVLSSTGSYEPESAGLWL
jgi:hypothetical protein